VPAPRILINAISLTQTGGGRSYVRNLLRELNRDSRGFELSVLAGAGALSREETGGFERLEVRLPPSGLGRTLARVGYEESVLPLRARRFDALYCLADLAPIRCATPTVVALRNFNIYDRRFYDTPRTRTLFRLVRLGLRRASQIVCPTAAAARTISAMLGLDPGRCLGGLLRGCGDRAQHYQRHEQRGRTHNRDSAAHGQLFRLGHNTNTARTGGLIRAILGDARRDVARPPARPGRSGVQ